MDEGARRAGETLSLAEELRFGQDDLLPVAVQDADSLEVLMLAFVDREALERTLETGLVHLWSRTRRALWLKGETSGRLLRVRELRPNCELSSLLVLVEQALPGACHTGHSSCFYRGYRGGRLTELSPQVFDPNEVYEDERASPLEELIGAYAWVRDQGRIEVSGTWRALRGPGPEPLTRALEEWDELLGVLEGTHSHEGFEEDAWLEAYQVLYWTCLHQVGEGLESAAALARGSLEYGWSRGGDARSDLRGAREARHPADRLAYLWRALGAACRAAGVEPREVIERDLNDLRSRPYMAGYFASAE